MDLGFFNVYTIHLFPIRCDMILHTQLLLLRTYVYIHFIFMSYEYHVTLRAYLEFWKKKSKRT